MQDATPSSTTALAEPLDASPTTLTSAAAPAGQAQQAAAASPSTTQLDRDQILDATWQCLREQGYDATTIRRIASSLGDRLKDTDDTGPKSLIPAIVVSVDDRSA